jgi:hypothetical protein
MTVWIDANGAPHPEASSYAKKFSGRYEHRIFSGGVMSIAAARKRAEKPTEI